MDHGTRMMAARRGGAPAASIMRGVGDDSVALGLPIVESGLEPASGAPFAQAMAAGIVELKPNPQGWRLAVSPDDQTRKLLFANAVRGRDDICLMPRRAFREMLRRGHARAIAEEAAHGLSRRAPHLAAAHGATGRQKLCGLMAALLLVAAAIHSPTLALGLAALATLPIFVALVLLRCGAAIEAWDLKPRAGAPLGDAELPFYTVLVPLHREAGVVPQLVKALARLDYPVDRLEIKFLVEHDDAGTSAALEAAGPPAHMEIVSVPSGRPRTKPRALNAGLMEARGALVAVFDAEDRPDPRQLRIAANLFARLPDGVACLQGRLAIDNADDGWLTRMFALEYAGLFDVINAGLIRSGLPVLLGGTSNHFRASALRRVAGWDAFNVTEDADLSFRLLRAGYRIADLPSATLEEAPARIGPWRRQRTRWMKGFMQTAITHGRAPIRLLREAGLANGLTLMTLCAGTVVSALAFPVFVAAGLAMLVLHGAPSGQGFAAGLMIGLWSALFVAGLTAMLAPAVIGARHRDLRDLLPWLPLMPLYYCLISWAAWAAVAELVVAPTRWNKTEHGQARTSRAVGRSRLAVRPARRSARSP